MIVYPQLVNPAINLANRRNNDFPIKESFSELGKSMFGRPKFTRSVVKSFSPSSPGGDGKALFITDANNSGNGLAESVIVGKPGHQNYFVQCDVYFNYQPSYVNGAQNRWERYGIFLRDDGFGGMTDSFEGGGNCYAILYDNDDGWVRVGRIDNANPVNLLSPARYETTSGWRTLRIEARTNQIKFFLNNIQLLQVTDNTFHSGHAGMGYKWTPNGQYPSQRGAYFDNFVADTLDPVPVGFRNFRLENGKLRYQLTGTVGTTSIVERTSTLLPNDWISFTTAIHTNSVIELQDTEANLPCRFYRARQSP
jgi:hypothetical protein